MCGGMALPKGGKGAKVMAMSDANLPPVIALVDDDRNILTSVSIALQAEGFTVRLYSDGATALKALLDNRARYARWAEKMGEEALFEKHPKARGYLRPRDGYRLFENRERLTDALLEQVRDNKEWLLDSLQYPLAKQA